MKAMRHFLGAAIALALAVSAAAAAPIEEETARWLAAIRAIKPQGSREEVGRYNKQMDDAWKFFSANKSSVLPILREELARELRKQQPSQLLLLDIGYFIRLQEGKSDKDLGRVAFFAIDPAGEIVRWNQQQYFNFAHAVAPDRDPRTLPLLDKAFLRGSVTAFVPQHALSLDETLVCVFLYGVYGDGAEKHLSSQLVD